MDFLFAGPDHEIGPLENSAVGEKLTGSGAPGLVYHYQVRQKETMQRRSD